MPSRPVVILDPGHGGRLPAGGSSPNRAAGPGGLLEKDLTLEVARRTRDLLEHLVEVRLTRDEDRNFSLEERARVAKDSHAAAFVSLHFNGSKDASLDGTGTWTSKAANPTSKRLAVAISERVSQALGTKNLGARTMDLGVLLPERHSGNTAACLAELAFLTNPQREESLRRLDTQQALALALAEAIHGTVGSALSGAMATTRATFDNTATHILEGRPTGQSAGNLRQKAVEILRAMEGLGVNDDPPGRRNAYIDAIIWGEPEGTRDKVRASFMNCNPDKMGACNLSSCGLVIRSVLRLLGASDPLIDPPYRFGTAISGVIDFARKHNAVLDVRRGADVTAANLEQGDIVYINNFASGGHRQHIFMIVETDGTTYRSIDGGNPNTGDGRCCGIKAATRVLPAGSRNFTTEPERPITHIIKLDRIPFLDPMIELVRKRPGAVASGLDVVGGGRAVADCPLLNSHGPAKRNLIMRWNVDAQAVSTLDVAVHLHGFVANQIDLADKEKTSGIGFGSGTNRRTRPTLALVPHGLRTDTRSSDGNSWVVEFPALTDSKDGLRKLIAWALDEFARTQMKQAAGSIALGRLILWAHSGGGARLVRLLANCKPDEIYFMDALYGGSAAAQAWAARHITQDATLLAGAPSSDWASTMAKSGGALRSVYWRGTGTESPNRSLHDSLECSLATVNDVAVRNFLRKYYRAGGTGLTHGEIPAKFTSQLLVDAGADLSPAVTNFSAPTSCAPSARGSQLGYAESADCTPGAPPRSSSAVSGSAFLTSVMGERSPADWAGREAKIAEQIKAGNIPPFLWKWKDVQVAFQDRTGRKHTGTFQVMPDYLAIGSDGDYALVPMDAITAQDVADALCCLLPTAKMVLDIYKQAGEKLTALPRPYWKTGPEKQSSTWAYQEHDAAIKAQRKSMLGTLVAGHKKDVVISPLLQQPVGRGRLAFYGFFKTDGTPWQGGPDGRASLAHEPSYADYSHGVRLVHPVMTVDGERNTVERVLADPNLAGLLSNEGAVTVPRITAKRGK